MTSAALTPQSRVALEQAATIAQPLATWLVRSGVGHKEFAQVLKTVFLQAAQAELARHGGKETDSALCLLSGVHRKDVRALLPVVAGGAPATDAGRPSAANQLVTRWLSSHEGHPLPFAGASPSFESLAASVSSDVRPRALLQELERLGVVQEHGGLVHLVQRAFVPDPRLEEAARLVAGSAGDHLRAAVHNLTGADGKTYLEQGVFADALTEASVRELEQLANQLWHQVLATTVKEAQRLSERDEPLGGQHRVRLGMFCFSAPMSPAAPQPPSDTSSPSAPS